MAGLDLVVCAASLLTALGYVTRRLLQSGTTPACQTLPRIEPIGTVALGPALMRGLERARHKELARVRPGRSAGLARPARGPEA